MTPNLAQIDCDTAWRYSTGAGVGIGIVDSGIHPKLNPAGGATFLVEGEYDEPYDDHGTQCASVARDVAPGALLYALKGARTSDHIVRAINWCIATPQAGIRVLNCSFGGGGNSAVVLEAIKAAGRAGILIVATADDHGTNHDKQPFYPACYGASNVLSIGACKSDGSKPAFSGWGATSVDLMAPGVDIPVIGRWGNDLKDGTSFAAPHAAGVAALLFAKYPQATPAQVILEIMLGASFVPALEGLCSGTGQLNAYGALLSLAQALHKTRKECTIEAASCDPNATRRVLRSTIDGQVQEQSFGIGEPMRVYVPFGKHASVSLRDTSADPRYSESPESVLEFDA